MSWGWWMKPIVWGSFVSDLGVIAKKCPTWPLRSSHCFKGSKISRVSQDLDLPRQSERLDSAHRDGTLRATPQPAARHGGAAELPPGSC